MVGVCLKIINGIYLDDRRRIVLHLYVRDNSNLGQMCISGLDTIGMFQHQHKSVAVIAGDGKNFAVGSRVYRIALVEDIVDTCMCTTCTE